MRLALDLKIDGGIAGLLDLAMNVVPITRFLECWDRKED
jgi:hypothetical protein